VEEMRLVRDLLTASAGFSIVIQTIFAYYRIS
jgi:hypothetical protein